MELRQIQALKAVSDLGSFRAAGDRLHQSAGTITTDIASIELELGVKLLRRSPRRMSLTQAGEVFLEASQSIAGTMERAARAARFADATGLRRVQLGHNGVAGIEVLRRVLPDLASADEPLRVGLIEAPNSELISQLTTGLLDLALVCPPIDDASLNHEPLLEEQLVLVTATTHPLATKDEVVWADLSDEPFVLTPRDRTAGMSDLLLAQCQRHGNFQPVLTQEANSVTSLLMLVASNAGVSFLPRRWSNFYRSAGTKALRVHDPIPTLPVHLAWQQGVQSPVVARVRTAIIAAAGDRRARTRRQFDDRRQADDS